MVPREGNRLPRPQAKRIDGEHGTEANVLPHDPLNAEKVLEFIAEELAEKWAHLHKAL